MNAGRTAVFFGGVVPQSSAQRGLAFAVGQALGRAGFALRHGGYNGLMEAAAQGAAPFGGPVVAVTVAGMDWGPFNPHVTQVIEAADMGERIIHYLGGADVVVAMGGGVGTLHEVSAAIWYAGNVRPVPIWLVGEAPARLVAFLREQNWLVQGPTRPLGFLSEISDAAGFDAALAQLASGPIGAGHDRS